MQPITGYIIVRKPLYDFLEPLTDSKPLEPVGGIYYNGIDRLNWYDVDTFFFDGAIPENLLGLYKKLGSSDNDLSNIKILKSLDEVNCFVRIDKDFLIKNEVIVISSPFLNKRKGSVSTVSDNIEWMGFDIVGGWSLIRHAIFENRHFNLLQKIDLNSYGLIDNTETAANFLDEYNEMAKLDLVDPLIEDSYGVDIIRIGRLLMPERDL